ncbi:hypothetical protein Cob_v000198 [Colletotrichum orbiculare MAFF 240422]|uniref:Stf2-like protein n=1 Tax=Colletotrichum orbiculare (strain 104-T / ATCC 96160 / CBS 514.97 / LARS 414 / MAFF 240422) TaxID=1213857 RepID=A0A484G898_COLOR|nr:hypothetical protein Cob_v000198 [Colletotrichum orbiculare MAFF 240422]
MYSASDANISDHKPRPLFITHDVTFYCPLTLAQPPNTLHQSISMTRSHKYNDRDHAGIAGGSVAAQEHLPRYFAKHGHEGVDPKKIKKNGGGRSNWGNAGEEVVDEDFRFTNARRRTNSSGYADNLQLFKTKFDVNEPEPVFEESIHGPTEEDGEDLTKTETSESGRSSSYGDDKVTKH